MNELELLTNFDKRCYNAEILASITIHTIQMPLCSSLMQLTSTDCINILVSSIVIFIIYNYLVFIKIIND